MNVEIPALYKHITSGKNYHTIQAIENKTNDTIMIMYHDHFKSYVRDIDDFKKKFKFIGD